MSHSVSNVFHEVSITNGHFNMVSTQGINVDGEWFVYLPVNSNNDTLGAAIDIYKWANNLPIVGGGNTLVMDGTVALITEPWAGANVKYHGSSNIWIGPGVNDITDESEDNAFFFSHLGSLSPATDDDAFYWDRAHVLAGNTSWDYYQYHKHLPTSYPEYENGRMVHSGQNYIRPADRAYGYTINTRVRVSGTTYQSVLARIHTPSVGGAHNSHNDVTLPTTSTKNYMQGGIIKGSGDRYHAFYIAANGTEWDVFNRTYVDSSASFTVEVNLGKFNLADPGLSISSNAVAGNCHSYPVRASAGSSLDTKIHFPVIMTAGNTSNFDLEIWTFNSADTIAGGSLVRSVLQSNSTIRPDCHLVTVSNTIYALATDLANGGVSFYQYANGAWETPGTLAIVNGTNSNNALRVHGLRYNTEDAKFYTLLSGTSSSTNTYTGPGLYSFKLTGAFAGYKHLDFDSANNTFLVRSALSNGYIFHTVSDATITKSNNQEPEGIASTVKVFEYAAVRPEFFHKTDLSLGGTEFIYHGIILNDDRKFLAGRVSDLSYGDGSSDLLVSIYDQDSTNGVHFAWGGNPSDTIVDVKGDDYITSAFQSTSDPDKVWITGYTKSEMVEKRHIKIHGYCRSATDPPNFLEWNDLVRDTVGNIYLVGTSNDGYCNIAKYSNNYNIQWQKQIGNSDNLLGNSIAIDNNHIYIVGTISSSNTAAFVGKYTTDGSEVWIKKYSSGEGFSETGTGVALVTKSAEKHVVVSMPTSNSTTFVVLNANGAITQQNKVSSLVVNKVRNQQSTTDGTFLFAGTNASNAGSFGVGVVNHPTRMIRWINNYANTSTTFANTFNDIKNTDSGATPGYVVVGSLGSNGVVLKVTASESSNVYTVTRSWGKILANTSFNGVHVSPHTDATKFIYPVGVATSGGSIDMGMNEGVIARYSSNGSLDWKNVFGHDMDESINGIIDDVSGDNLLVCGWSESHSTARDSILFRCEKNGFGTGRYHIHENPGMPYFYAAATLTDAADSGTLTDITAPADFAGSISIANTSFTLADSGATIRIFDGSYGKNGVFMLHFGYVKLSEIQKYLNSEEYKENQKQGKIVNYANSMFKFWQVATVGDGTADDGNVFGYDIIEASSGKIYIIGQTSGDIEQTNLGTSGVYDYLLIEFDPITEEIEYYQNGTSLDEETYALCELSNGKIAFTGRTTGDITGGGSGGDTPQLGGYDIFLGIFTPNTETFDYYNTGTGLDDRGINIHDLGSNTLAITFSTYGNVAASSFGSEDVGVKLFNYATDTWGNSYQIGTAGSDLFEQNGKPSVLLEDGRIALVFSTGSQFAETGETYGFLDIALAVLDTTTGTWSKTQVGSQSSETVSSIDAKGERVLISGHVTDTFGSKGQGVFVEADANFGIRGKSSA